MIVCTAPQGSQEWLNARKGVITGSRFKDARDRLKNGQPSKKCIDYAMNVARERCGGSVLETYANAAMKIGTNEEPKARMAYELATDEMVIECGFICTEDRKFGVSVDGRIRAKGLYECKAMVSSETLFTALVRRDISEYRDQCVGEMWLLCCDWVDLHLWVYDMPHLSRVIRIQRNEDEIQALEDDMVAFEKMVSGFEAELRALGAKGHAPAAPSAAEPAPWDGPASLPVATPPADTTPPKSIAAYAGLDALTSF